MSPSRRAPLSSRLPVLVPADVQAEDLVHVDALVVEEVGGVLAVDVLLGEVLYGRESASGKQLWP